MLESTDKFLGIPTECSTDKTEVERPRVRTLSIKPAIPVSPVFPVLPLRRTAKAAYRTFISYMPFDNITFISRPFEV